MWQSTASWKSLLRKRPLSFHALWCVAAIVPILVATGVYETRTSVFQARVFSAIARRLTYQVTPGASSRIVFPSGGPFNESRGYSEIPRFSERLVERRFHIAAQSVFSTNLQRLSQWGITPPYREPLVTGLVINDDGGNILFDARSRHRRFASFDQIPPLVVNALLFIENRELYEATAETHNPVIDWARSAKAVAFYAAKKVGLSFPVEGGSTLATQIEKYQYSENGRTRSVSDKFLQMVSASIRVYREGEDTRRQRQEIILDYLNSAPLSAAPGYGEVYGMGDGLLAWFGKDLDTIRATLTDGTDIERQQAFKYVLAILCATRAPSYYLRTDPSALEARVEFYLNQMAGAGVISSPFAEAVRHVDLKFLSRAPAPQPVRYVERKATNAIRTRLLSMLNVPTLYDLDRLQLTAQTTLNATLQKTVIDLFENLKKPAFIESHGLKTAHLLLTGDPSEVTYGLTLFERTPFGNALRVQADTLDQPFDVNEGMKLELGSTAKLRTLAQYLNLVAELYHERHRLNSPEMAEGITAAQDPITQWVRQTIHDEPAIDLPELLDRALDRKYSGNPGEVFFTGGGAHVFANFDRDENSRIYTLREGLQLSVNLVYIRLMRDIVRYHQARLPYNAEAVLDDLHHPLRQRMLTEIADQESEYFLRTAYRRYRGQTEHDIIERLLGQRTSQRKLAMLYLAWNMNASSQDLLAWLRSQDAEAPVNAQRLYKSYDPHRLTLEDFAYLLGRHPLEIWCAGQIVRDPHISWDDLFARSAEARNVSSKWLFRTKNRRAQDVRLRTRVEKDAFDRMLPDWQRLGFPFDHLVPSLATAIGSSADRPIALAELMGIILNDGLRMPVVRVQSLQFAAETPYETQFEANTPQPERIMDAAVAQALRQVLASVVENGTATRLRNAFVNRSGTTITVGGKTGSGDNRLKTFNRGGGLRSVRAVSRTGTFVFYMGDRYFGVLTAYVAGDKTNRYSFTSALPVAVLKLLAPELTSVLEAEDTSMRLQVAQDRSD